jgi:hypothetical protein
MTNFEKQCYNDYLAVSRSQAKKPYTIRKKFEGFELKSEYIHIRKICNFLSQFPQIRTKWYFKAPYEVYPDQTYFPLEFYASQKAIKTYSLFMKLQRNKDPDNEDIINFIKESLKHIGEYCIKNNIPIDKYINHKEGVTYAWAQHLKEYKICIYPLLEWPAIYSIVNQLPTDEKNLFLGEMADNLITYRQRLSKTNRAKIIVSKGIKRIRQVVKKYLKNNSE